MIMKRMYALLMILVLLFSQTGCSSRELSQTILSYVSGSDSAQKDQTGSDSGASGDGKKLFALADSSPKGTQPRLIYYEENTAVNFYDEGHFGYLALAYYAPKAVEPSVGMWQGDEFLDSLYTLVLDSGWVVAYISELPQKPDGQSDADYGKEIILKFYYHEDEDDHNPDLVLSLSDLGEPMTQEELCSIGFSLIEGHVCYIGYGGARYGSYGFELPFAKIWVDEYHNLSYESVEKIVEKFHFYAGDGTPLDQYFEGYYMQVDPGFAQTSTYLNFYPDDGQEHPEMAKAMCEKLQACKPYMEYTGPDGVTQRFPFLQK